ncbi:hypothetical protein KKG31_00785 [Patescibacteria group bacterium]|nr:hypothetical protein [Patescibacteria group bacterium]MBU1757718.1 hypothetical protein [Patescibacteria group bacterium]
MQGNNSNFIIKEVKQKKEVKTPKISPEMSRLPELKAEEIKIGESYI